MIFCCNFIIWKFITIYDTKSSTMLIKQCCVICITTYIFAEVGKFCIAKFSMGNSKITTDHENLGIFPSLNF